MSLTGNCIRVETPNSTAVSEVAFEPRIKSGVIYVVPRNGNRVYTYTGHRALFEAVAYAGSVGRAWGELLREPLEESGDTSVSMILEEFEEKMLALSQPIQPLVINFPPSLHAW